MEEQVLMGHVIYSYDFILEILKCNSLDPIPEGIWVLLCS